MLTNGVYKTKNGSEVEIFNKYKPNEQGNSWRCSFDWLEEGFESDSEINVDFESECLIVDGEYIELIKQSEVI